MTSKTITRDELQKLIKEKEDYTLIDLRRDSEMQYGMIPTAKQLPAEEIEEALQLDEDVFEKKYGFKKPTKETKCIVYCRSGGRSGRTTKKLEEQGYNVTNYAGSALDWAEIDENVKKY